MLKVMGTKIWLTRGDSAFLQLTIMNEDGTPYEMQDGDIVLFTVKRSVNDKDLLFQKRMDNGVVEITPEDTENLAYGDYVYDCQLKTFEGIVQTFITPSQFRVLEEVTY